MLTFLALMPAVLFMLLAQLGRRYRWSRALVYLFFGLTNALLVLDGVLLSVRGSAGFQITVNEMTFSSQTISPQFMGRVLLATGALAFLLMLPLVQRGLALFMRIRPGDPVHTLALIYACYLVGLAVFQTPLLEALAESTEKVSLAPSELWGQAAALTLLALVGVGVGVERSLGETARRLKLAWPGWREVRAAMVATVALVFMQTGLGALWMLVSPESMEAIDRLSKMLLGEFFTPWGAVMLGLSAGISEELVFRGALQPRFGILVTSILFALVHTQYQLSFALVIVFLLGLGLGIVRNRVNTTASILTHALYNAGLVLLAIYVPGMQ